MLTVNPLSRTGVCRNCGPVVISPRRRKGRTAWVCKTARDEQRGSRGPRVKAEGRKRSDYYNPGVKCAACGIKPIGDARAILKIVPGGFTLCANCRVLLALNRSRFIRATGLDLPPLSPSKRRKT